jgi:arginine-tRNA-protein transferase
MELKLQEVECGPCPYLEGREWRIEEFSALSLDPGLYEQLLGVGFRRSGRSFYRNTCVECGLCVPVRLDVEAYLPSKTLRRLTRLNSDLALGVVEARFSQECYELYARYKAARHGGDDETFGRDPVRSYTSFLISSPFKTTCMTEYRLADGRLAATGYVDILPKGISSVYFAFDPDLGHRSIGLWSVAREIELARSLGKRWYYLGFWVPGSRKMDYKARFAPFEYAHNGVWTVAADREAALAALGAS